MYKASIKDVQQALRIIRNVFPKTPLERSNNLSLAHNCHVFLKREDLTPVRSYKIRGALNWLDGFNGSRLVTCSAGNHAQGVAYACAKRGLQADIYMPSITSGQKVSKVAGFGGANVKLVLEGMTFDESFEIAQSHCQKDGLPFIHPFDDKKVIEGQATVGLEILEDLPSVDYLLVPVGGGGLSAGLVSIFKELSPKTKLIGLEPMGAPSLTKALSNKGPYKLEQINSFVDGASVKRVGDLNYPLLAWGLDSVLLVDEGHVCSKILKMYNENGIIIEPAGVLSLCALDLLGDTLSGSTVVCVVSGGNSDVFRMPEILERSLIYEGKKQYFKIEFPQRAGALKEFIMNTMGPTDDIIYFRYTKHINKEFGPVILGVETKSRYDSEKLIEKMGSSGIVFERLLNVNDI